jgi:hypothetical protein
MNLKKTVYVILTIILGCLLIVIAHSFLELWYFNAIYSSSGSFPEKTVFFLLSSYLPPVVPIILLIIGIAGGHWLGQTWWRLVYIEHRHWRYRFKHKARKHTFSP